MFLRQPLGEVIGWRMSFPATAGLGVVSMVALFFSLPKGSAGERPDVRRELSVLMRPQVLSALLTTVLGQERCLPSHLYFAGLTRHYPRNATLCYRDAGADWRRLLDWQLSRREIC